MNENHMREDKPIHITDDDFDREVLQSEGIVVVDFWAPWCGPCHTMASALEAFATVNSGKAKVCKIDADDNPKTAEYYEIRSLPTVIFFKDGQAVETCVGALTQQALQDKVERLKAKEG